MPTGVHHRDRCAIVGIGATDFSRDSGRSDLTLATQAALAAIDDAGLPPADIDGIVRCDMDTVRHNDLADALGLARPHLLVRGRAGRRRAVRHGRPGGRRDPAPARPSTVLVFRALNGRSGRRFGLAPQTQRARRRRRHLRRVLRALRAAHARADLRA